MPVSRKYLNTCLSYIYARYTYRDTDLLEDKHVSREKLDMDFYVKMVDFSKMRFYEINRVIKNNFAGRAPSNDKDKELESIVVWYSRNLNKWDKPEIVRNKFEGTIIGFVLGGEFQTACKSGKVLSDELMKSINKDVCNRYYTLLHRDVLSHDNAIEIRPSEGMTYSEFFALFKTAEDFEVAFGQLSEQEARNLITANNSPIHVKACMMQSWKKLQTRFENVLVCQDK